MRIAHLLPLFSAIKESEKREGYCTPHLWLSFSCFLFSVTFLPKSIRILDLLFVPLAWFFTADQSALSSNNSDIIPPFMLSFLSLALFLESFIQSIRNSIPSLSLSLSVHFFASLMDRDKNWIKILPSSHRQLFAVFFVCVYIRDRFSHSLSWRICPHTWTVYVWPSHRNTLKMIKHLRGR